jgi:sugar O-acyltransferase (sialic acid O-acetyltransferase NeuD family)
MKAMQRKKNIIIVGAGRQGRVVLDILDDCGLAEAVVGFIDAYDNPSLEGARLDGKPVLGTMDVLGKFAGKNRAGIVIAVGDNTLRKTVLARVRRASLPLVTVIHPSAVVSRKASIGEGAMIHAQAAVGTGAKLGAAVIVNTAASVDHDCVIGDCVHMAVGARLAGNVTVGECTLVGIGSSTIQGIHIGKACTIGAGASVVTDIPDGLTAVGVPAKPLKRRT